MTISIRLHLGAHKTASTHVQAMLRRNRKWLARQGVGYAGPKHLRVPGRRLENAFGLRRRGVSDERCVQALRDLAGGQDCLVLSEENILGRKLPGDRQQRLYADAPARLAGLVAKLSPVAAIDLFLSVRDMAPWMSSVYRQQLAGGRRIGFDRFAFGFVPAELRWSTLIEGFRAIDGVGGITVWPFEHYGDHAREVFAALLSPGLAEGLALERDAVFQSFSAEGVAHLLDWDGQGDARQKARQVRRDFHVDRGFTPFRPWPDAVLAASKAAYAADLDRIAAMPGVRLLRPAPPVRAQA